MKETAKTFGIYLSSESLNVFEVYKNVLKEWNADRVNLTSISDDEGIAIKHFIDSLILSKAVDLTRDGIKMLDVGTGAGFPGIPLKIAFRNLKLTLIESQKKKALFIAVLLSRIGLNDVDVFNSRGELLAKEPAFREQYDIVVMREFGKVPLNLEIGIPFVKQGGFLVLWKGEKDLKQVEKNKNFAIELGASFEEPFTYKLGEDKMRYLCILKKGWSTPRKYPRSYAVISKGAKKHAI